MEFPFRRFRYATGEHALNTIQYLMSRLPLEINRLVMDIIFFVVYPIISLLPSFRRPLIENLTTAFGNDLTHREIRRIARRTMRNIFHMPGDLLYYCFPHRHDRLKRDVTISGMKHLRSAVEKGKGVIGLGAHMTGFLLLTVRFSQSDIPFVILTKDQRNTIIRNKLNHLKDINGVRYIDVDSPDKGKGEVIRSLERNELVYLIADERKKRDGLAVPFFGKKALTAVGPAVFSIKTGAPILPIFIAKKGERFVIDILPPIHNGISGGERAVYDLTLKANRAIEDYIRRYPDQWVWTQQRWRL